MRPAPCRCSVALEHPAFRLAGGGRRDVEITQEARPLIGGIRDDDRVVVPGYPDQVRQEVIVIRDDRRIASVGFVFEHGRWLQRGGFVCGGSIEVA